MKHAIYKLTKATTPTGGTKSTPTTTHMFKTTGFFYGNVEIGKPFVYMYLDDSGQIAASSEIVSVDEGETSVTITTTNTKYYFSEVSE